MDNLEHGGKPLILPLCLGVHLQLAYLYKLRPTPSNFYLRPSR